MFHDLGSMPYAHAYQHQTRHVSELLAARDAGRPERGRVLLLEHDPPVITLSRRESARAHLLATPEQLARAGVALEQTDRGGDITYHGPGQLVVYPILDLNTLGLNLHRYMRLLEQVVIDTCADFGLSAHRDPSATGVWVSPDPSPARPLGRAPAQPIAPSPLQDPAPPGAKLAAIGVRIRRWVSMHGLALNVTTNLDHFNLIVPCGLAGRGVTSLRRELGPRCPSMDDVKAAVARHFERALTTPA